jgi:nitrogen regulatory protein PII
MKKVTAYINTARVRSLVEALQAAGVDEIMVTEYFKPLSQASRLELCCDEDRVAAVSEIIHRLGTTGRLADHSVYVRDFDPNGASKALLGQRISSLDEVQLGSLVKQLFAGIERHITGIFLIATMCVLGVGLFVHMQLASFQENEAARMQKLQNVKDGSVRLQAGVLEGLFAVDQLHRSPKESVYAKLRESQEVIKTAERDLRSLVVSHADLLDSIVFLDQTFQTVVEDMIAMLALKEPATSQLPPTESSHERIMGTLYTIHMKLMATLSSLEQAVQDMDFQAREISYRELTTIKIFLLVLSAVFLLVTILLWATARQKVSRPIQIVVQEARTIDSGDLR